MQPFLKGLAILYPSEIDPEVKSTLEVRNITSPRFKYIYGTSSADEYSVLMTPLNSGTDGVEPQLR